MTSLLPVHNREKITRLNAAFTYRRRGFTIIEVLIFVALFGIALVTILGTIIYSSFAFANAQRRTFATHHAEELMEWIKYQRELGGFSSISAKGSATGTAYCFNNTTISNWPTAGACATNSFILNNVYRRQTTITNNDVNTTTIQVQTAWKLLGQTRTNTITLQIGNF